MEKEFLINLGNNIKKIRKAKGLTFKEVTSTGSMEMSSWARIEKGRTSPTITTLIKFADALEVSLPDLLDFNSPAKKNTLTRQIKYTGLTVYEKSWVYGIPCFKKDKVYINRRGIMFDSTEVIPESIGQYTGYKLTNNQELYENHIVLTQQNLVGLVEFFKDGWSVKVSKEKRCTIYEVQKVIGNLVQNKDLISDL